jgi:K+-sensing histidine kinase KdpD
MPERSAVIVSVRDFGPGLPKEELRSIFDPYHNGRMTPAGARGIMMGLTICRQIVEAMDGSVVASSPEGGGLEVSFSLPLAA